MAVYNGGKTLETAVQSVLDQDYQDWELVVIDDGSSDETPEILANFAEKEARIKVFRQPNRGLIASLNAAIGQAEGAYLARLDADDACLPGRLRAQACFLDENPDVGLVGGNFVLIDENGSVFGHSRLGALDHAGCVERLKTLSAFFAHSSWMMRRSLVERLGGYSTWAKKAEDYEFLLRAIGVTRLACLAQPLIRLRKSEGSESFDPQCTQYRTTLTAWLWTFGDTGRSREDLAAAVDQWFAPHPVGRTIRAGQQATLAAAPR